MADNRETENKPNRVPVSGLRDILTVYGKNPDFSYRFVEDADERGSRIQRFLRGGWNFTRAGERDEISVGQECVYKSKQDGSIVRYNTGGGRYSYLMQIPMKLFKEDQRAKEASIAEQEQAIVGKRPTKGDELGQYGEVKLKRD